MEAAVNRPGNLAALAAAAGAFACAHARPATVAARPPRVAPAPSPAAPYRAELAIDDFTAQLEVPAHPMPGDPALLVLRSGSKGATEQDDALARAAVSAGLEALELESGSPGRALLWLGPRAKRIYVAAEGVAAATAAELVRRGRVAGLVLLEPPAPPAGSDIPCLVVDAGPAASRQRGRLWELTLPDLNSGGSASAESEHTWLEATALWLTARAKEP